LEAENTEQREQVFDLFHDAVTLLWVLDVAHD
jgi:hypothetical protein